MTKAKTGGHPEMKLVNPGAAAVDIGLTAVADRVGAGHEQTQESQGRFATCLQHHGLRPFALRSSFCPQVADGVTTTSESHRLWHGEELRIVFTLRHSFWILPFSHPVVPSSDLLWNDV